MVLGENTGSKPEGAQESLLLRLWRVTYTCPNPKKVPASVVEVPKSQMVTPRESAREDTTLDYLVKDKGRTDTCRLTGVKPTRCWKKKKEK